jgi:hypothetical protein
LFAEDPEDAEAAEHLHNTAKVVMILAKKLMQKNQPKSQTEEDLAEETLGAEDGENLAGVAEGEKVKKQDVQEKKDQFPKNRSQPKYKRS